MVSMVTRTLHLPDSEPTQKCERGVAWKETNCTFTVVIGVYLCTIANFTLKCPCIYMHAVITLTYAQQNFNDGQCMAERMA